MKRLIIIAAAIVTLTGCTQAQMRAWRDWHRVDPDAAMQWLDSDEFRQLAAAPQAATSSSAPSGLSDCDEMMHYAQQAGLPDGFRSIGWRESNCRNEDGVRTSCCHGYWQLHAMHFAPGNYIDDACGADSIDDVNSNTDDDKRRQACAARQLYNAAGMSPWKL